ncbi:hypothetical protein MRX96_038346 [Rhipicephalus microplus]
MADQTNQPFHDAARTLVGAVEDVIDRFAAFAEACGSEGSVLDGSSWSTLMTGESSTGSGSALSSRAHVGSSPSPRLRMTPPNSNPGPDLRDVPSCPLGLWPKEASRIRRIRPEPAVTASTWQGTMGQPVIRKVVSIPPLLAS